MLRPVLLMILFMSCTSIVDTPEHADVTKYYYDISSSDGTEYSDRIVQMVSDKIGMKKCAITNYSGTEWPFYQEYSIDEKVKNLIRTSVKKALDSPLSPITNLEEDSYA